MYSKKLTESVKKELEALKEAGKFKIERELEGAQGPEVSIAGKKVLMFASNNYLGLANHPEIVKSAHEAIDQYGFGLSSVRFISGTETIHKTLEKKLAEFLGTEDSILYSTNFMSNLGFFATVVDLFGGVPSGTPTTKSQVAIYSDELNHASIIDAFKLCKKENVVKRIYPHGDLVALEKMLKEDEDKGYRFKIIVTDGVFSMDGNVPPLGKIYELAHKYDAMIMVDESHSAGVVGKTGRGVTELFNLKGKLEIITGTLGKAFGGAIGGFTTGKKEIIEMLRQRSRPYLFSNSLPPMSVNAGIKMFEMMAQTTELQDKLHENTEYFVEKMIKAGFDIKPTQSAICAVMLYDAKLAQLLDEGIYVIGFYFPVVAKGEARIRVQLSAAHKREHLDKCINAFTKVGKELKVIK